MVCIILIAYLLNSNKSNRYVLGLSSIHYIKPSILSMWCHLLLSTGWSHCSLSWLKIHQIPMSEAVSPLFSFLSFLINTIKKTTIAVWSSDLNKLQQMLKAYLAVVTGYHDSLHQFSQAQGCSLACTWAVWLILYWSRQKTALRGFHIIWISMIDERNFNSTRQKRKALKALFYCFSDCIR